MLPTEACWEKAARGANSRRYPWGSELTPEHANYDETGIRATSSVGVFPDGASPYLLLDVAGNVWEWTKTKWADNYQKYKPDDNLEGESRRSLRGGAWLGDDNNVRCSVRYGLDPNFRNDVVGFRVVSPGI